MMEAEVGTASPERADQANMEEVEVTVDAAARGAELEQEYEQKRLRLQEVGNLGKWYCSCANARVEVCLQRGFSPVACSMP